MQEYHKLAVQGFTEILTGEEKGEKKSKEKKQMNAKL